MLTKESRQKYSDILVILLFLWFYLSSFLWQPFYEKVSGFGTLILFLGSGALFLINTDIRDLFTGEDKRHVIADLAVMAAADVLALLNLFILGSNKGAALVIWSMTLVLFLAGRITVSENTKRILSGCGCILLIPWYAVVRWDYGFNMAGLAFLVFFLMGVVFLEYIKNDLEFEYLKLVQAVFFAATMLLLICYHARSMIVSLLVFGMVWLLLHHIRDKKLYFRALCVIFTLGSIAFTGLYSALGATGFQLRILYKDVLSGREGIWSELWGALIKQPLTGVGSSYELKSFFIFEVHNGLFDILAVHGIPVFILFMWLLYRALFRLERWDYRWYPDRRLAVSGVFALLTASFFENCFIVPPYSMIFFALLLLSECGGTASR
ncbi:O-antigen ligase like membrane protein [Lachnospiraceae bacterium]|nr:O-antigen ligase like membrane protein [Lachnospiraceae bacterium]